jgi:hypothetical protein
MKYEIKKLSPFRLLSIYGYEALGNRHNMYANPDPPASGTATNEQSHHCYSIQYSDNTASG